MSIIKQQINDYVNPKEFDRYEYYKLVLKHCKYYLNELKIHYKLEININEYMIKVAETLEVLKNPILLKRNFKPSFGESNEIKLKRLIEQNGFNIDKLYNEGFYQWFIPENISLCIVYCLLGNKIRESKVVSGKGMVAVCKLFNFSRYKICLIKNYIGEPIEEKWGIQLDNFQYTISKKDFSSIKYYKTFFKYCRNYINKLRQYFKLDIDLNEYMIKVKETLKILKNPILLKETFRNSKSPRNVALKRLLEIDGFNIEKIYNEGFCQAFMPKNISLFLVYCLLVNKIRESSVSPKGVEVICKLFNLSRYKFRFIKHHLGEPIENEYGIDLDNFKYTDEKFERKLNLLWKETNRGDVKLVLELFRMLSFNFKEFVQKITTFNFKETTSRFLSHFKDSEFCYNRYIKIQNNIKELCKKNRISNTKFKEASDYIDKILGTVGKTLNHSVSYNFRYIEGNIKEMKDKVIQGRLLNLMENIMINNYPLKLFFDNGMRGSDFCLQGITKEKLRTETIVDELINPLIKNYRIKTKDDDGLVEGIKEIAKKTIKMYAKEFSIKANHDPIQIESLLKLKEIIAMEVPIWYDKIKGNELTGHIDLVGIKNDKVIIMEYKPIKVQVYKGLIQACIYGYLFSKTLRINIDKLECIVYSPDLALRFSPKILEDIIQFVHKQNSERQNRLKLKKKPNDLKTELLRISKLK